MQDCIHKTTCRVCGEGNLVQVLDLGSAPPANAYLKKEELERPEKSFPLVLYFCRTCSLAQLLDVVNPEILFRDYHYVTGASSPLVEHYKQYAAEAIVPLITSPEDLVVDIGGNDGTLLSFVKDTARVLNVDPAENLARISEEKGVPFYATFFTSEVAGVIIAKHGKGKVVVANNLFAHTDPIRDVFEGVAKLIGNGGTFIFEVHWAKHLIDEGCFDQIYHEHLCFYSLHALKYLVEATGMTIFDVQVVPMQGQSLRIYAGEMQSKRDSVDELLDVEREAGLTDEKTFLAFGKKVSDNKQKLPTILLTLKAGGNRIVGYGAPAKGSTLLNYYKIGTNILDYLTDTTPQKQGLYSPGTHVPIVSPECLYSDPPNYILLLAWNFKDAILEKEKKLRSSGVKFIIPVADITIV